MSKRGRWLREGGEEMEGLPKAVEDSLIAHPSYSRGEDGIAACDGPGCDWRKNTRGSTKKAWRKHQKARLLMSIEEWYYQP